MAKQDYEINGCDFSILDEFCEAIGGVPALSFREAAFLQCRKLSDAARSLGQTSR